MVLESDAVHPMDRKAYDHFKELTSSKGLSTTCMKRILVYLGHIVSVLRRVRLRSFASAVFVGALWTDASGRNGGGSVDRMPNYINYQDAQN